jgi:hypothetical protein
VRFCMLWIAWARLAQLGQPSRAQEQDLGSLPLPERDVFQDLLFTAPSFPQVHGTHEEPGSYQEQPPVKAQKGTSDDRILWTLPNFLNVENADSIPPLTPGQKFKVVARGVFDPFEFVLIGSLRVSGWLATVTPPMDRECRNMRSATGRPTRRQCH